MPNYKLPKHEGDGYMTIELSNGATIKIPLVQKLKIKKLRKLMKIEKLSESEQMDVIIDFFSDYIGEELLDDMEYETLSDIYELWLSANSKAEGLTMGESSPSAGS